MLPPRAPEGPRLRLPGTMVEAGSLLLMVLVVHQLHRRLGGVLQQATLQDHYVASRERALQFLLEGHSISDVAAVLRTTPEELLYLLIRATLPRQVQRTYRRCLRD